MIEPLSSSRAIRSFAVRKGARTTTTVRLHDSNVSGPRGFAVTVVAYLPVCTRSPLYVWYAWALGFDRRNSYRKRRAGSVDLETNGASRKMAYETPGEKSSWSSVTFGTAYKRAKHRSGPFIVTRTPIVWLYRNRFPDKYLQTTRLSPWICPVWFNQYSTSNSNWFNRSRSF